MEPRDVTKTGAAHKLLDAAKQIEAAAAVLDRTANPCEHCSALRWSNRDEYQMGIELDAMIPKLRRFAAKLGYKEQAPQPTTDLREADRHIGEAGRHKGHRLELLVDGRVYCNTCEAPLSDRSADTAWPPENMTPRESESQS